MDQSFDFSLHPIPKDSLTEDSIEARFSLGYHLLESIPTCVVGIDQAAVDSHHRFPPPKELPVWRQGKRIHDIVSWRTDFAGEPWFAQVTKAADMSFDVARELLFVRKLENERTCLYKPQDTLEVLGEDTVKGYRVKSIVNMWCLVFDGFIVYISIQIYT